MPLKISTSQARGIASNQEPEEGTHLWDFAHMGVITNKIALLEEIGECYVEGHDGYLVLQQLKDFVREFHV